MRRVEPAAGAVLLVAAACAGVAHRPPPPPPAALPFAAPRPFAALYRLDCCGQRGLLLTVRGDGERLALAVASGPAGTVVEAWVDGGGGVVRSGRERCVRRLAGGRLALAGGAELPARPAVAALLARGLVAEGARPSPGRAGWLECDIGGAAVRWRVAAGVVVEAEVAGEAGGEAGGAPTLSLVLADHHGRVPGRIAFRSAGESGALALVEWRENVVPAPPAWVSWPQCEAAR
jgi:hypothetical protein